MTADGRPADPPRGHRILPHTADLIIEAWGSSRVACLEEAVDALVQSFCDAADPKATESVPLAIESSSDLDLLVQLLDEVVYLVEVLGVVPIVTSIEEIEDGGVAGFFEVVPIGEVEATGAVPKGVSQHDLRFGIERGRWTCRAVVDV